MVAIHDISMALNQSTHLWPGDPALELRRFQDMADGDPLNASRLTMSAHMATHVDTPLHFIRDGGDLETLALDVFVGPAEVVDLRGRQQLHPEDLEKALAGSTPERLLLLTDNSLRASKEAEFFLDFVAPTNEAARWLVERGIRLVGIDYLSIQRFDEEGDATHKTLLGSGVAVLEGLTLLGVAPGTYRLVCLPLKLAGSDGVPARAVLLDEKGGGA